MERDSRMFKVYDTRACKYRALHDQSKGSKGYDDKGGSVIAAEYVEIMGKQNVSYVATTSNKPLINFWDPVNYMPRGNITPTAI